MLNAIFADVPERSFDRCLELGAGDGYLSTLVARHARMLVSTEIRIGRLSEPPPGNTRYLFCDAERLPFLPGKFDLIFSSHLLEHLPDLRGALDGMRRALHRDGIMVHLVPSRLWKLLDLGLFFPSQAVHVIERYGPGQEAAPERSSVRGERSTVKQSTPGWWRRSFWPPVHGVGRSNFAELVRFGVRRWVEEFERAELDVVEIRRRFPLHSPYRLGFEKTRGFLESLGASSTIGFVLAHAGRRPRATEHFAAGARH